MLRVLALNPTTTLVGFSRYRTKILLFYLLWIYAPPYPSRAPAGHSSPAHPPSTCTASTSLSPRSSISVALVQVDLPLGATPFSHDAEPDADLPSPLTAAYLQSAASSGSAIAISAASASSAHQHMPARGSTSRDLGALNESGPTPPLSEQPAAESAAAVARAASRQRAAGAGVAHDALVGSSDDASPRRRARRTQLVDESATCSATPPAPPSPRLTPLTYTLLIMHFLFLVELVLVSLETSPSMSNLPSTLPCASSSSSAGGQVRAPSGVPSSPSLAKRLARARWRISTTWTACGQELVVWTSAALVLGTIGATWRSGGGEGWNAVLGPQGWTRYLRLAEGDEVAACTLGLVQSILPLLVGLGLVESSVPVPSFLEPPPASPSDPLGLPSASRPLIFTIPVLDLTQQYLRPSLSFLLSTLQLAQLVLARPPSHSLLNWRTLAWLHAAWCAFGGARRTKTRMTSLVAQVRELARTFPVPERGAGDEWRCSICFEGEAAASCEVPRACAGAAASLAGRAAADESKSKVIGFKTLCTLPCRHSFHVDCLVHWFRRVAFCPTCHRDARSTPGLTPSRTHEDVLRALREARLRAPAAVAAWARAAPTSEDEYPGARAAAAREGRRTRTVDLDALSASVAAASSAEGDKEGEPVEARAAFPPRGPLEEAA
ncbi:hypothetical protein JCM9279_003060 [Rhodotorula babjevae]